MKPTWTVEPARANEYAAALRLIFRHSPPDEQSSRVANGLELIGQRALDPAGVLVVRGSSKLQGAVVVTPVPGAGALIWPPQVVAGPEQVEIEDALVQHACAWLRSRGVKLTQSLLAAHECHLADPLTRNGFRRVTQLWYLRHDLNLPVDLLQTDVRCRFQSFAECDRKVFDQTLLRSYEGTLDCPEVNGVRAIGEIIEGHQSQGLHDPERWWLATVESEPVGVLLATAMPQGEGWDLAYLGIVPEARRQGHGREMTLKALCEAKAADAVQMTLSVDVRNRPAWQLYRSVGFEPMDERAVFLWLPKGERRGVSPT